MRIPCIEKCVFEAASPEDTEKPMEKPVAPWLKKRSDIFAMNFQRFLQIVYTVVKVDGATPKRWLSRGPW